MQRVKMSKKKNEPADSKWRHSTEAVEKGKVTYMCKFLGSTPVGKSKGSELIKEAIKKVQFANDIKKSEEGLKASKLRRVELCVSVQNLILTDAKTKTTLYSFPLQRISYCADDKSSKRLFGFIAREKETPQHHCYVLESEKNAEELTLAVGQAFDLAYKKFKASQGQVANGKQEVDQMKQRVQSTEKENEMLRKKLEELEKAQQQLTTTARSTANGDPVKSDEFERPEINTQQATFDPFSESATFASDSKSPSAENPFSLSTNHSRPETFAHIGSNPFAAVPSEKPANNEGDLLNMFTATENIPVSSTADDPFDPLLQVNDMSTTQEATQQPVASFSSFDQVPAEQTDAPASLSRPKAAPLSAGLLPPPPTKQSIKAAQKEKQRNSNPPVQQGNGTPLDLFAGLDSVNNPSLSSDHQQGIKEVQDGMENNLVLF